MYVFVDNSKPAIVHKGSIDWPSNKNKIGYETAHASAEKKNFFDRTVLINKFDGLKKPTTLLEIDSSELTIKREIVGSFGTGDKLMGAHLYGYDKDALDSKIREALDALAVYERDIAAALSFDKDLHVFYVVERDYILKTVANVSGMQELQSLAEIPNWHEQP